MSAQFQWDLEYPSSLLTEYKCMPARSIGPDFALNLFRRCTPLPVNNSTNNKDSKKQENPHSRRKKGLTKRQCTCLSKDKSWTMSRAMKTNHVCLHSMKMLTSTTPLMFASLLLLGGTLKRSTRNHISNWSPI